MFPVNNIYPQKVVAILNTIGREIFHVKKVFKIMVIMIILNIFFLSMYTKNMIINENLLNLLSRIINLLSGF